MSTCTRKVVHRFVASLVAPGPEEYDAKWQDSRPTSITHSHPAMSVYCMQLSLIVCRAPSLHPQLLNTFFIVDIDSVAPLRGWIMSVLLSSWSRLPGFPKKLFHCIFVCARLYFYPLAILLQFASRHPTPHGNLWVAAWQMARWEECVTLYLSIYDARF